MNRKKGSAFQVFLTQGEVYGQPQAAHESLDLYFLHMYIFLSVIVSSFSLHAWPNIFPFLMKYLSLLNLTKTFHNKSNAIYLFSQAEQKSSQLHLTLGLTSLPHILTNPTTSINTPGYTQKKKIHIILRPGSMREYLQILIPSINLLRPL